VSRRAPTVTDVLRWNGRTQDNLPVWTRIKALVLPLLAPYVRGPASAVNNRIAVYDGITGKLIKDGGQTIAEVLAAAAAASSVTEAAVRDAGRWEPLTNDVDATPELVFNLGDVIMVWHSGP
jgi:hypothetical protein